MAKTRRWSPSITRGVCKKKDFKKKDFGSPGLPEVCVKSWARMVRPEAIDAREGRSAGVASGDGVEGRRERTCSINT
jgi:hypothetical protein